LKVVLSDTILIILRHESRTVIHAVK
jgi:hypothetical protein